MQSTKQGSINKPTLKVRTRTQTWEGKYHTKEQQSNPKFKQSPVPSSRERFFHNHQNSNTLRSTEWGIVQPTSTDMSNHLDKYSVDFSLDEQDVDQSYIGDARTQNNYNVKGLPSTYEEEGQGGIIQRHSFPEDGSMKDCLSYNNSMQTDTAVHVSQRSAIVKQFSMMGEHQSAPDPNMTTTTKSRFTKFPFEIKRTSLAIVFAIAGLVLGFLCKNSTEIVELDLPMDIGDPYEEIRTIGIFYIEACFKQEENNVLTIVESNATNLRHTQEKHTNDYIISSASNGEKTCQKIKITTEMVGDGLWNTVFFAVGMATSLGCVFFFFLITTTFWKDVNLLPISIGIFFTYLFQSLAFFFFDTELCKVHGCHNSSGTLLAILSPVCWFTSGLAVLSMMLNAREIEEIRLIQRRQEVVKAKKSKRNRKDNRNSISTRRERYSSRSDTESNSSSSTDAIDLDLMLSSLPNSHSI